MTSPQPTDSGKYKHLREQSALPSKGGLTRIGGALRNTIAGFREGLSTEAAIKQEAALLIVALPVAYFIATDVWAWVALVGSLILMLGVELLNTAVERLCNHLHPEKHEAIIFDLTPHMHLRGKSMVFTAEYPNGEKEVLLDVPQYDFNWQLTYTPTEPKILPAGTRLGVQAVFDNSADNPDNPDPAANVRFGEKTTDEMMVGFVHYTFVDKSQQVDMPTFVVPEALRAQVEQLRRFRQQQREAKAAAEAKGSGGDR